MGRAQCSWLGFVFSKIRYLGGDLTHSDSSWIRSSFPLVNISKHVEWGYFYRWPWTVVAYDLSCSKVMHMYVCFKNDLILRSCLLVLVSGSALSEPTGSMISVPGSLWTSLEHRGFQDSGIQGNSEGASASLIFQDLCQGLLLITTLILQWEHSLCAMPWAPNTWFGKESVTISLYLSSALYLSKLFWIHFETKQYNKIK